LLIATLCPLVCGIPLAMVAGVILPGAAVSIVAGNLFYSWQAWRLARRTGRDDVTALPCGINTVSLIAFLSSSWPRSGRPRTTRKKFGKRAS
jgi:AGZA family xanthine/uracil permease-like MFS transporter